MNFELAKKLKENGFPQNYKCNHHSAENCSCQEDWQPTLSELIEACGEDFFKLDTSWITNKEQRNKYGLPNGKIWLCNDDDENTDDIVTSFGSTPEESVANLWLELNKK